MPWKEPIAAKEQVIAEKREAILKEAARSFNRRGYYGTSLDEIAKKLGITKPALYYYIRDKEDLLFACHQLSLDIAMGAVAKAKAAGGPAREQLRGVLRDYIQGLTDELNGCVVLLEEGALTPPRQKALVQQRDQYEGALRELVCKGIEEGDFVPCDAKLAVFTILGAVNWISKWYSPKGERPSEEIGKLMAEQLVRGLEKTSPGTPIL
ncbi:MAG: TetR/AcrR family transcriptional regulator [Bdellovibrionota bacterium]